MRDDRFDADRGHVHYRGRNDHRHVKEVIGTIGLERFRENAIAGFLGHRARL